MEDRLEIKIDKTNKLVETLALSMARGFEQVDKRFEQVDKRFEQVDKRFEQMEKKIERIGRVLVVITDDIRLIKDDIFDINTKLKPISSILGTHARTLDDFDIRLTKVEKKVGIVHK